MILVKPSIEFIAGEASIELIELVARTCYKSEDAITKNSAQKMYTNLLKREHDAMTEFGWIFYKVICDRGVTHEVVRHRLFSFAQESTRYCNYKKGVTFVIPPWVHFSIGTYEIEWSNKYGTCYKEPGGEGEANRWFWSMALTERDYCRLLTEGWSPQYARSVLPNSLKTEINIAGNVREWRHFFKLRCSEKAHPQMQEIAKPILVDAVKRFPGLFDDIKIKTEKHMEEKR